MDRRTDVKSSGRVSNDRISNGCCTDRSQSDDLADSVGFCDQKIWRSVAESAALQATPRQKRSLSWASLSRLKRADQGLPNLRYVSSTGT